MSDVIDIIHNLSYQVSGDGLDVPLQKMKAQADQIDKLKGKLVELQDYYNTAQNVQQQENAQVAINKTTRSIELQTAVLQKQFNSNKAVQGALQTELGIVQKLTDKLNDLRHARERQTDVSGIRQINTEIANTRKELTALTMEGGKSGGVLSSLFGGSGGSLGKQLLTGGLIGLGLGGGMGLITRAVSAAVDALSEFIDAEFNVEKRNAELQKANEDLTGSFNNLTDSIQKGLDLQKQVDLNFLGNYGDDAATRKAIDDNTVDGAKRKLDALKAIGAINQETGNAEAAQLKATLELRDQELKALEEKRDIITNMQLIISQAQNGNYEINRKEGQQSIEALFTSNSAIPERLRAELKAKFDKDIKDGVDFNVVLENLRQQYIGEAAKNNSDIANKTGEKGNTQTEYDAKIRDLTDKANKDLHVQLEKENDNYRQLKEKGDIQSVDKIVADTQAKYKLLYNAIYRSAVDEAKKFPGFDKKNPLANLPKPIRDKYNALFGDNGRDQKQDAANQQYDLAGSQYSNYLSNSSGLSGSEAGIEKARNAYGLPSYDDLAKALDADTQAKKDALRTQFVNQASSITDSTLVIEAQRQYDEKLTQIDNDAYKERLNLADEYYSKLSQKIINAASIVSLQISTSNANRKTSILSGRGGKDQKSRRTRRADLQSDQEQQTNTINEQDQLLPGLGATKDNSALALDAAKGTDGEAAAQGQYDKDAKAYEEAQNKKSNARLKFQEDSNALDDMQKQHIIDAIDLTQTLAETTVKSYDVIADARQKDLDREISVRTQRVEMAEKLAERGNTTALAQEQKALDTAQQQKRQAALQEQEINAALVVSNALVAVAKAAAEGGVAAPATIALAIIALGVGFAEAEALSNSSKSSFKDGVVNFRGKGGPQDDANPVNISSGESVITAAATAKYGTMLEAMNKGLPVFGPPPTLAPHKTLLPDAHYATKADFKELKGSIDTLTDVVAGKETHVSQTITKGGIHQIVKDETRAHANQWRT